MTNYFHNHKRGMIKSNPMLSMVASSSLGHAKSNALLSHQMSFTLLSGTLCGALIFLLRSKEVSWIKKILYFCVSLIGGYAITPELRQLLTWLPTWPAAFLSATVIVTMATALLDWSAINIPILLTKLAERFVGNGRPLFHKIEPLQAKQFEYGIKMTPEEPHDEHAHLRLGADGIPRKGSSFDNTDREGASPNSVRDATLGWRTKLGVLSPTKLRRLQQLEAENAQLWQLVADLSSDIVTLQNGLSK